MTKAQIEELSPTEYSKRTGISLGHLYVLLRTGRLPDAYKKDGQWRIQVQDSVVPSLDKWGQER